jgi:hypothetical protein
MDIKKAHIMCFFHVHDIYVMKCFNYVCVFMGELNKKFNIIIRN